MSQIPYRQRQCSIKDVGNGLTHSIDNMEGPFRASHSQVETP